MLNKESLTRTTFLNTLIRANRFILIVLTRNFMLNTIMEKESWWWHKMIPFFFQALVELVFLTLYKNGSSPLRISSVNVAKSEVPSGFRHIY